jgi:hypothetical protein
MPKTLWAKNFGSTGNFNINPESVIVDDTGTYLTGYFYGSTITFGDITLTKISSAGTAYYDTFLVKLNKKGKVEWAKNYGSVGNFNTRAYSITIDNTGIYLTGYFEGTTLTFGDKTLTKISSGNFDDTFLVKLNKEGQVSWAKNYGSVGNFNVQPTALTNDNTGVYLSGYFDGTTITFGDKTLTKISSGNYIDTYLVKLNKEGQVLWAKNYGSDGNFSTYPDNIDVDNTGIYLSGRFFGETITFGDITLTRISSDRDTYLALLSKY